MSKLNTTVCPVSPTFDVNSVISSVPIKEAVILKMASWYPASPCEATLALCVGEHECRDDCEWQIRPSDQCPTAWGWVNVEGYLCEHYRVRAPWEIRRDILQMKREASRYSERYTEDAIYGEIIYGINNMYVRY